MTRITSSSTDSSPLSSPMAAISTKKANKPLMEKRRRERINRCVTELKTLVLNALKRNVNNYSKLEKADILELTVDYLREVQNRRPLDELLDPPVLHKVYDNGFAQCSQKVVEFLCRSGFERHAAGFIAHLRTGGSQGVERAMLGKAEDVGDQRMRSACVTTRTFNLTKPRSSLDSSNYSSPPPSSPEHSPTSSVSSDVWRPW